jgi:hypothetical protein
MSKYHTYATCSKCHSRIYQYLSSTWRHTGTNKEECTFYATPTGRTYDGLDEEALKIADRGLRLMVLHLWDNAIGQPGYDKEMWIQLDRAVRGFEDEAAKTRQDLNLEKAVQRGDYWHWQGDGHDFPESLTCPVVMTADQLRELLAKTTPAGTWFCPACLSHIPDTEISTHWMEHEQERNANQTQPQ